jgi:hypothetical protein
VIRGVRCAVRGHEERWLAALILAAALLAAFAWPFRADAQRACACRVGLPNSLLAVATGGRTITLRDSSLGATLRDSTTLSCRHHYKGGHLQRAGLPLPDARPRRTPVRLALQESAASCDRLTQLPTRLEVHRELRLRYPYLRDTVALDGARVVAVETSSNPPPASLAFHLRAVKYLLVQP